MSNLHPYSFFFDLPLYTKIKVDSSNTNEFYQLMQFRGGINAYNPLLKENTTYKVYFDKYISGSNYQISSYEGFSKFTLTCVRNNYSITCFVHLDTIEDENGDEVYYFQKIGQLPSIADLHISKIKEYDKVLDREKIKEVTRAIGLAANGVGIGSFVYLRRVFEDLVEEAHQIATKDNSLDEDAYDKGRMVEKIELLKNYLPNFLVANKSIYGILSLGIHELTEQDCLKHFEAVRVGIELILDEKIEKLNKQNKIEEAQRRIQMINQQLKEK
jgi:hypothetical protein